jgi:hypothetical protein
VPVGTYNITAEAKGFKTGLANGIALDVSQQREVNFTLAIGGVTATVEVNAAPPLLNTTNATLANVVSSEQVEYLPLNGRSIDGLMLMQPGIVASTAMMGWMGAGMVPNSSNNELVGNGNWGETSVGTLDGADTSDAEMGTLQLTRATSSPPLSRLSREMNSAERSEGRSRKMRHSSLCNTSASASGSASRTMPLFLPLRREPAW